MRFRSSFAVNRFTSTYTPAGTSSHTEALIRRGLALEKLEGWEKALESYDRALAIDPSLTVAYLYKGGVCNKLQRHREALDSYEHALHSEKRSRAS